jgi:hypothetical protein
MCISYPEIQSGLALPGSTKRLLLIRGIAMSQIMLVLLFICLPVLARDNGHYTSVSPEIRQWFRAQKSPKTGSLCCNEADGTYAEEDIRDGVYWTRFELTKGEWIPVPADVVIKDPNRNGAPVAWWYIQDGKLQIRCYAPGGGA